MRQRGNSYDSSQDRRKKRKSGMDVSCLMGHNLDVIGWGGSFGYERLLT